MKEENERGIWLYFNLCLIYSMYVCLRSGGLAEVAFNCWRSSKENLHDVQSSTAEPTTLFTGYLMDKSNPGYEEIFCLLLHSNRECVSVPSHCVKFSWTDSKDLNISVRKKDTGTSCSEGEHNFKIEGWSRGQTTCLSRGMLCFCFHDLLPHCKRLLIC